MGKKKKTQEISNEVLCAEYASVYHYVLSICRNETEAQDITQETFLKAMNAATSFHGNSSLYTWLCTIVKNLWINRCKKQNREITPENLVEIEKDDQLSIEQRIVEKETAKHIHKILHHPCAVVKVGDTVVDMLEGKNAGAWSIGILQGSNLLGLSKQQYDAMDPEELEQLKQKTTEIYLKAGADMVIDSIRELPAAIEKINCKMAETEEENA